MLSGKMLLPMIILFYLSNLIFAEILIPVGSRINWKNAGLFQQVDVADNILNINDYPGSYDQKILMALSDAQSYSGIKIIYFPPSNYNFYETITLSENYGNIILQGAGSNRTILTFHNNKCSHCIVVTGGDYSREQPIFSNLNKTGKIISNVSDTDGYNENDWIQIIENRNPEAYWERDGSNGYAECGQISYVTSVGSNTIQMADEASKSYNSSYSFYVRKMRPIFNVGIENLKIIRIKDGDGIGKGNSIFISNAINCWIRGVESHNAVGRHITAIEVHI